MPTIGSANDFPTKESGGLSGDGYERRGQHRKSESFLSAPRNLCRQLDNNSTTYYYVEVDD